MDTSTARQAIFSRIRKAQQRSNQVSQGERDAVQDYLPDAGYVRSRRPAAAMR